MIRSWADANPSMESEDFARVSNAPLTEALPAIRIVSGLHLSEGDLISETFTTAYLTTKARSNVTRSFSQFYYEAMNTRRQKIGQLIISDAISFSLAAMFVTLGSVDQFGGAHVLVSGAKTWSMIGAGVRPGDDQA